MTDNNFDYISGFNCVLKQSKNKFGNFRKKVQSVFYLWINEDIVRQERFIYERTVANKVLTMCFIHIQYLKQKWMDRSKTMK